MHVCDHFVSKISAGNVTFEHSVGPDGTLDITMTFNIQKYEDAYLEETLAVVFGTKLTPTNYHQLGLDPVKVMKQNPVVAMIVIVGMIMVIANGIANLPKLIIEFLVTLGILKEDIDHI